MGDCKFDLSEEKLDELFVNEVGRVTILVMELPDSDTIMPTCTRWLQIFHQSTAKEKFARNWMLLEMHKQLNEQNTLGYPFTDDNSCHMDLISLHKKSMAMSKTACRVDEDGVSKAPCSQEWDSVSNKNSLNPPNGLKVERQLIEENAALIIKLQKHQLKYKSLQQRLQRNLEIRKSLAEENMYFDKELGYIKQIFCWSAISATKYLYSTRVLSMKSQYFTTLFSVLYETKEPVREVIELDMLFEKLIRSRINNYLREQRGPVLRKISKNYDTLRAKVSHRYKNVLRLQQAAQEKELSLMAMRYLTLLRKLFLASFNGSKTTKRATLKFLQDRYNEME